VGRNIHAKSRKGESHIQDQQGPSSEERWRKGIKTEGAQLTKGGQTTKRGTFDHYEGERTSKKRKETAGSLIILRGHKEVGGN